MVRVRGWGTYTADESPHKARSPGVCVKLPNLQIKAGSRILITDEDEEDEDEGGAKWGGQTEAGGD